MCGMATGVGLMSNVRSLAARLLSLFQPIGAGATSASVTSSNTPPPPPPSFPGATCPAAAFVARADLLTREQDFYTDESPESVVGQVYLFGTACAGLQPIPCPIVPTLTPKGGGILLFIIWGYSPSSTPRP